MGISPGFVKTDRADTIANATIKAAVIAIEQPEDVDIVVRPTVQD